MELSMSGGALRTFSRCVTCLARIGSDLVFQAYPDKLELHTLNSSRSAFASVSLTRDFFDHFHLPADAYADAAPSSTPLQCSVLLKSVLAVLRTPTSAIDRLNASLPNPQASKLEFVIHCELTVIATEPAARLPGVDDGTGGKAVELLSYIDPTKDDYDSRLHTQLWIDPAEEFLEYEHAGDPVDVTFGVKELKAFLTFCEGCEVDILLFYQKAGEPVLLAPRFGFDDGSSSNFDVTLVLATMLVSQLNDGSVPQQPPTSAHHAEEPRAAAAAPSPVPENVSNHTRIWSELSDFSFVVSHNWGVVRSESLYYREQPVQMDHLEEPPEVVVDNPRSQHHPSNWVGADEDDDDEEDEELFVQTTPHYMD
uniref:Uncharacterized protein n=1 Tax=Aegilops tauschii TaxID=37682 RepID=R7W1D5_AEGTA